MRRLLTLFLSVALIAGCAPASEPVPLVAPEAPRRVSAIDNDPILNRINEKLLISNDAEYQAQRLALTTLRRGSEEDPTKWPSCNRLSRDYVKHIQNVDSLIALQEAMLAAKIDDHVACDTPVILKAMQKASYQVANQFVDEVEPEKTIDYLINHPSRSSLNTCWLDALRSARQHKTPYNEAYAVAAQACENPIN